jgi:hypothetical protein
MHAVQHCASKAGEDGHDVTGELCCRRMLGGKGGAFVGLVLEAPPVGFELGLELGRITPKWLTKQVFYLTLLLPIRRRYHTFAPVFVGSPMQRLPLLVPTHSGRFLQGLRIFWMTR